MCKSLAGFEGSTPRQHPAHPRPPAGSRSLPRGGGWFGALRAAPWLADLESQTCHTRKCPPSEPLLMGVAPRPPLRAGSGGDQC